MHGVLELKDILYTTHGPTDLYFIINYNTPFIIYTHRGSPNEVWVKTNAKINIASNLWKGVISTYKVNLV